MNTNGDHFKNVEKSAFKVFAMFVGELEYADFPFNEGTSTHLSKITVLNSRSFPLQSFPSTKYYSFYLYFSLSSFI